MIIKIEIPFEDNFDFSIRYTIADTIEERELGEVIEEGTGEGFMELLVEIKGLFKSRQKNKIKSLVESFGLEAKMSVID